MPIFSSNFRTLHEKQKEFIYFFKYEGIKNPINVLRSISAEFLNQYHYYDVIKNYT